MPRAAATPAFGGHARQYRNVLGLPGGLDNATMMPLIEAANTHKMPLLRGAGGPHADREGEYVVYVYDSRVHPFFRGEALHNFHTNDVIQRPVPRSYTHTLKEVQRGLGRLDGHGCLDPPPAAPVRLLWPAACGLPVGLALVLAGLLAERVRGGKRPGQPGQQQEEGAADEHVPGGRVAAVEVAKSPRVEEAREAR